MLQINQIITEIIVLMKKNHIYFLAFVIVLLSVGITISCKRQDFFNETSQFSPNSDRRQALADLDPSLRNVLDLSSDKDMLELTNKLDKNMSLIKTNSYVYSLQNKKLKAFKLPKEPTKNDLKKTYSELGMQNDFEPLFETFNDQSNIIVKLLKAHPELKGKNQEEWSKIFLKAFKLNHIKQPKKTASIYKKIQEPGGGGNDAACYAAYNAAEDQSETNAMIQTAAATALYVVAVAACLETAPAAPSCIEAAQSVYAIAEATILATLYSDHVYNLRAYNICMGNWDVINHQIKPKQNTYLL